MTAVKGDICKVVDGTLMFIQSIEGRLARGVALIPLGSAQHYLNNLTPLRPAIEATQEATLSTTIETPDRTHVPQLERAAWNQMPKSGVRDLRLFRYDGTDLYAWYGKNGVDSNARNFSVFDDALTEPFRIILEGGA